MHAQNENKSALTSVTGDLGQALLDEVELGVVVGGEDSLPVSSDVDEFRLVQLLAYLAHTNRIHHDACLLSLLGLLRCFLPTPTTRS